MTQVVQSALRVLDVLEHLNVHNGATQREVCEATGLSRGTAYRLLETLRKQGFVRKDKGSLRYWLTARVRSLADGYHDEGWIDEIAAPLVVDLGHRTRWPVSLLTLAHAEMLTRVTTDYDSPFTERKFPSGRRVSLLWSAAGRTFFSYCDATQRTILMESIADARGRGEGGSFTSRTMPAKDIAAMVQRVRQQGYEIVDHPPSAIYSLAVPVMSGNRPVAAISMHLFRASIKRADALKTLLPAMRETARAIGDNFDNLDKG